LLFVPVITTAAEQESQATAYLCSCISFARAISPFPLRQVEMASDIPVTHYDARPGDWIVFEAGKTYSAFGHAGVIMEVGTSTLKVVESNFRKCEITVREISKWDKEIKGFFRLGYFAKL
jgi:hypothetical protein